MKRFIIFTLITALLFFTMPHFSFAQGINFPDGPPKKEIKKRQIKPLKLRKKKSHQIPSLEENSSYREEGKASYYGAKFEGKKTASGELFSHQNFTAAHKTLPFGTKVKVINLSNQKSIEVIINDRGPHIDGRIIDLSSRAFSELDQLSRGIIPVKIEVIP